MYFADAVQLPTGTVAKPSSALPQKFVNGKNNFSKITYVMNMSAFQSLSQSR
jgi:hypothetical protein